jgi:diguanylate cyclase (GGDEF)-like protein
MAFSIRTKLLIGYLCVVAIILIVGSMGLFTRLILTERMEKMVERSIKTEQMHRLTHAIGRLLMPANDYLISGDREVEVDRYRERLDEVNDILSRIEVYEREEEFLNELKEKLSVVKARADEIFSLSPPEASEGTALMYSLDKAGEDAHQILFDHALGIEDTGRTVRFINRTMGIGAVSAILLSIVFVIYLERSIRLPIERLSEGVKGLSKGRWTRVEIKDGPEITNLANEFNNMVERLQTAYDDLEKKVGERTAELNELNKKLETLSITDGLTGLYNHRYFYDRLAEEIERAKRYGNSFSLVMIDIDHFKHYNDRNGHLAGDVVLKGIADCLSSGARDVDIVSRYGGEEFAIIAQEFEREGAVVFSERIRKIVEAYPFPNEKTQPGGNITISLGVALYPEDTDRPGKLVGLADGALYRAKQMGRNRVESVKRA